ncbi:MFS transporter [Streptomyces sp. NPDC048106]|uniref:MFS transporter n=1 Tax=Streptomyces sp. NPDC048106 TaxID=3155750 RepID=UPI003452416C
MPSSPLPSSSSSPPSPSPSSSPSSFAVAFRRLGALASFRGRHRILHLTTLAFFLTFLVWFDMAPFAGQIAAELHLTKGQSLTLSLCNLALTVPARIGVGMLLDRFGPRRVYASILIFAVVPNTIFATASSFPVLVFSRLLLGVVGAGFVVGIRMVAEWFSREEIGTAEGFYGGWGNFGSAAASLVLPGLSVLLAGHAGGWRWGIGLAGVLSALYGLVYLFAVRDTPEGSAYQRPRRQGALEVTSRRAVFGLLAVQLPPIAVLGLVAYRICDAGVIPESAFVAVVVVLVAGYAAQAMRTLSVNRTALADAHPPAERYPFRLVALLSLAYFVTFGTELAVVSLLPAYFADTFGLGVAAAAAAGSAFACTNLVTRPAGGLLSDALPQRRTALRILLVGAVAVFLVLSRMTSGWGLWAGVALAALASVFIQGGNGAVYAMVPLVNRRAGGQIAGLAGAYGNVGGIVFTSVLVFDGGDVRLLFLVIAVCAAAMALLTMWLPEPQGTTGATGAAVPTPRESPLATRA